MNDELRDSRIFPAAIVDSLLLYFLVLIHNSLFIIYNSTK